MIQDDFLVHMVTNKVQLWRRLIASFHCMNEVTIKFSPVNVRLMGMNTSRTCLNYMTLHSKGYFCAKTIVRKLDAGALYKMISDTTTDLEMAIAYDKPDVLHVSVYNEDWVYSDELKTSPGIDMPVAATFTRVASLPTTRLQSMIQELSSQSSSIQIECTDQQLVLSGASDFIIEFETRAFCKVQSINESIVKEVPPTAVAVENCSVVNKYSSLHLREAVNTLMGDTCELFMKESHPLVLRWKVDTATGCCVICQE